MNLFFQQLVGAHQDHVLPYEGDFRVWLQRGSNVRMCITMHGKNGKYLDFCAIDMITNRIYTSMRQAFDFQLFIRNRGIKHMGSFA